MLRTLKSSPRSAANFFARGLTKRRSVFLDIVEDNGGEGAGLGVVDDVTLEDLDGRLGKGSDGACTGIL